MTMKNLYIKLFGLMLMFLAISCNDEIPLTLQDEYVGIDLSKTQFLYLRTGDNLPVASGIRAMLIAPQRSTATNFTFTIGSGSTAIEGIHYTVNGTTGSIPANSSFGEFPISILPDNIEAGEVLKLELTVTGGDIDVAEGLNTANFNIQILCPNTIPLDKTWTANIVEGAFGAPGTRSDVTITDAGDGTLLVSDITAGVLPSLGCCDADESANILNVCDAITIARTGPDASFPYETNESEGYGAGSWDAVNQVLTLKWWEPNNGFGAVVEFTPN
jgi:hypothetical protein